MTAQDCLPLPPPETPSSEVAPAAPTLPPWGRKVVLLSAGAAGVDVLLHGLHGGQSWLGLGALVGGWCWLAQRQIGRQAQAARPKTVEGWAERCQSVLTQFAALEAEPAAGARRADALQTLLAERERGDLRVALVGSQAPQPAVLSAVQQALRGPCPLRLLVSEPLPSSSGHWQWSDGFAACDALIFHLRPPLTAADLRWLEALPGELPLWLLVQTGPDPVPERWLADLHSQWPASATTPTLPWGGDPHQLGSDLASFSRWLAQERARLPRATLLRGLEQLHGRWQADLERLRRGQWRQLQQRTQWLVAGGVLLTPSWSVDLLVVTVANGLMLREMARLWNCSWTLEQLKAAAVLVGKAALALGLVEWSTQAVTAAFKLHPSTWLVGGGLQALSAAYLTRVIGHAMADLMARSVGVSEPDLEAIKAEAPLLVARAAAAERLQWGAFLREARGWLGQQGQGGAPGLAPGA